MSNIPKSEREPTKVTHYVKVLDLRKTIIKYLEEDFGIDKYYLGDGSINPRYWLIKKIRDNIYELSQDMVKCITAANTIYIYRLYEYDDRRRYFTQAIADCQSIIQELSIVCDYLLVKPGKYEGVINQINDCIESIKDKRQNDNYFRLDVLEREAREKAKYENMG